MSIKIETYGRKEYKNMNTYEYIVVGIDGDYANLKRTDIETDEIKLVARALLPEETDEGTRLRYEMLQYSVIS